MKTYRLKKGYGSHKMKNGHRITKHNPIYETEIDLVCMYPDKFEEVSGRSAEMHAFGSVVTEVFPLAETIPQCVVWKKGRRYRICIDGDVQDTTPVRLATEKEVNANLKSILKAIQSGQEDEESEMDDDEDEPEDDDTEDSEDESEENSEDEDSEDEDEEKPAKAKKAKGRKGRK